MKNEPENVCAYCGGRLLVTRMTVTWWVNCDSSGCPMNHDVGFGSEADALQAADLNTVVSALAGRFRAREAFLEKTLTDLVVKYLPDGDARRLELQWMERHREADYIVTHPDSKTPIKAEYMNPRWDMAKQNVALFAASRMDEEEDNQ